MKNRKRNRTTHLLGVLLLATTGLSAQQQAEPLGWSACGAYVAPGEWRSFMCYNLGAANTSADPFTPSWEINGGYWQWGRKELAAAGPSGPGEKESGAGAVAGWNAEKAPNGAWEEQVLTRNDPCPFGFRVPTSSEWEELIVNNLLENIGSWTEYISNFSGGWRIGRKLFLPATGFRMSFDGKLGSRGSFGGYWSSSVDETDTSKAWFLGFDKRELGTDSDVRTIGFSVRCIGDYY